MKRTFTAAAVLLLVGVVAYLQSDATPRPAPSRPAPSRPVEAAPDVAPAASTLADAIEHRRSNVQVEGEGTVVKVLEDDREGSRHQRFILRLESGRTLLIAHNVDLSERIPGIAAGDVVAFHGEYEWNPRGGVVHWTHRDPDGRHPDGWLRHRGRTYQ